MQQLQQGATLQNGKYRIEKVLGQGGFGITYLAMRMDTGSQVAIKELFVQGINDRKGNDVTISNPVYIQSFSHQKEKFSKEARRIHNIDNPHVVKVYDSFEENGTAYYTMQFVEGYSLGKLLKKTIFSEEQSKDILIQLLDALSIIHSQNIWHLDIKPDNILLDNKGNVILIDFGASKHIEQNGTLTTSSSLAMTPGFAAPEQMQGDISKFGPWTDFYALGGTLYTILTKNNPPSFADIISEESHAFSFPSNVSDQIRKLITWMMEPNRNKRPQDTKEIKQKLSIDALSRKKHKKNYHRVWGKIFALFLWVDVIPLIYCVILSLSSGLSAGSLGSSLILLVVIICLIFIAYMFWKEGLE